MPEIVEVKPEAPVTPEPTVTVITPEPDLITRVSQVKTELPKEEPKGVGSLDQEIQNLKTTEEVIKWAKEKEKEWASGYGKKFQETAELRKQLETKLAEASNWSPERLKQELSKPDFVQAAKEVLQTGNQTGLSDEQYSALSETEKAELNQLKQKINVLEQSNWQAARTQQDVQLRNKYADYDPKIVDEVTQNLMIGKVIATREDLWKVIRHDENVKRAYELGLADKRTQDLEKINGMSTIGEGRNITSSSSVERQKGETIQAFMKRSYAEHTKK